MMEGDQVAKSYYGILPDKLKAKHQESQEILFLDENLHWSVLCESALKLVPSRNFHVLLE